MDKIVVTPAEWRQMRVAIMAGLCANEQVCGPYWAWVDDLLAAGGYAVAPEQEDSDYHKGWKAGYNVASAEFDAKDAEVAALRKRLVENHDYICERDDDVRELTAEVARMRGVVEKMAAEYLRLCNSWPRSMGYDITGPAFLRSLGIEVPE